MRQEGRDQCVDEVSVRVLCEPERLDGGYHRVFRTMQQEDRGVEVGEVSVRRDRRHLVPMSSDGSEKFGADLILLVLEQELQLCLARR